MKELKDVLSMVAEGLKSFADGMGVIAGKVDTLAQSLVEAGGKKSAPKKPAEGAPGKKSRVATAKRKGAAPVVKKPVKKAPPKPASSNADAVTASDTVLQLIRGAKNGIDPNAIREKTGFDKKKVSNILHRLKQQGKIKNAKRGLYSIND